MMKMAGRYDTQKGAWQGKLAHSLAGLPKLYGNLARIWDCKVIQVLRKCVQKLETAASFIAAAHRKMVFEELCR